MQTNGRFRYCITVTVLACAFEWELPIPGMEDLCFRYVGSLACYIIRLYDRLCFYILSISFTFEHNVVRIMRICVLVDAKIIQNHVRYQATPPTRLS